MQHYTQLLKTPDAILNMARRYPIEVRAVPAGFEFTNRRSFIRPPPPPIPPRPPSNADLEDFRTYRERMDVWREQQRQWEQERSTFKTFEPYTQTALTPDQRRLYVKLSLCVDGSHPPRWGNPYGTRGAVQVDASVENTFGGDGARAYFLPWNPTGGTVQMTIPRSPSTDLDRHPCVFFTSAIAGCSVIFKGTADEPTIIHGGTSVGSPTYDANRFWGDMVEYADTHPDETGEFRYADRHRPVMTQVTKNQYVSALEGGQTVRSRVFWENLKNAYGPEVEITGVYPWGCVFGIRRGMNWQFYLQENANIYYYVRRPHRVYKKVLFFKVKGRDEWQRASGQITVSRAMALTEVFPGGGGRAMLPYRFRTLSELGSNQLITAPGARPVN